MSSRDDSASDADNGKGYLVREIELSGITVHAEWEGQSIPVEIDRIDLVDVGSGQDVDMEELSAIIVKAIFAALLKHPDALPGVIAGGLRKEVDKIGDLGVKVVEQFGDEAQKAVDETVDHIAEEAGEAIKDIADGIGDLLPGKKQK